MKHVKKKRRGLTLSQKRGLYGILFASPFIIGFFLFFLSPLIESIRYCFSTFEVTESGYKLIPVGWENFNTIFRTEPYFIKDILDSLRASTLDMLFIIIFSFFMATVLNQRFKGRTLARAILFLPVILMSGVLYDFDNNMVTKLAESMLTPPTETGDVYVTSMNIGMELLDMIQIDSRFNDIIMSAIGGFKDIVNHSGVQILIFLSALQTIPTSLREASSMEGCTSWEYFWKIVVPILSPMILVNVVYTVIDTIMVSQSFNTTDLAKLGINSAKGWIFYLMAVVLVAIIIKLVSSKVFYEND